MWTAERHVTLTARDAPGRGGAAVGQYKGKGPYLCTGPGRITRKICMDDWYVLRCIEWSGRAQGACDEMKL